MPHCQNCGSHVTKDYARVFTPDDVDQPRCCPECPDKLRDNGRIRDARATRENTEAPTTYDAEKAGGASNA